MVLLNFCCFVCTHNCTNVCARCKSMSYCSKECQRKDWTIHKKDCVENTLRLREFRKLYKFNALHRRNIILAIWILKMTLKDKTMFKQKFLKIVVSVSDTGFSITSLSDLIEENNTYYAIHIDHNGTRRRIRLADRNFDNSVQDLFFWRLPVFLFNGITNTNIVLSIPKENHKKISKTYKAYWWKHKKKTLEQAYSLINLETQNCFQYENWICKKLLVQSQKENDNKDDLN